jgi:hypothetical protein
MMQICKDNQGIRDAGGKWTFPDMQARQESALNMLLCD